MLIFQHFRSFLCFFDWVGEYLFFSCPHCVRRIMYLMDGKLV
nr:MAG TPA: hypothetical protein [Caudoviricetes sp.]